MPPSPTDPVFKRPRSKFWQIRYTDHHHREVRISSGTEVYEDAWAYYERLKAGSGLDLTTMAERFFEEHQVKPKTKACYLTSLRAWVSIIGNPRIEAIDRGVIQLFVSKRLPKVRHGTIRNDLAFMSSLLVFAGQLPGGPEVNIVSQYNKKHLKLPEVRVRYLRADQMKLLLEAIPELHKRLIVLFGLEAGLRREEILNLKLFQVNLWTRTISLIEADQESETKTGLGRRVPMSRALIRALIAHLRAHDGLRTTPGAYLIVNPDTGKPYTDLRPWWPDAVEKAKLKDFHFHDTRHHYASIYLQRGGRLETLKDLLGHATIRMTERYAALATGDAQAEYRRVMRGVK